jgi:hypothetical protein
MRASIQSLFWLPNSNLALSSSKVRRVRLPERAYFGANFYVYFITKFLIENLKWVLSLVEHFKSSLFCSFKIFFKVAQ